MDKNEINRPKKIVEAEITPIFIVGMPRSGSTLLEQMLCSHSEIQTVGEVDYISNDVVFEIQKMTKKQYPLDIDKITEVQLSYLRNVYFKKIRKDHPKAKYIIDKMPANFQSVGLIKKILPNAVIINIKRNSTAIALSVFRNYFSENEPYFCDLKEFDEYYDAYNQLMKFWSEIIQADIIELSYELLVESPKGNILKVLNHCNLKWESRCLKFHESCSKVKTLSQQQVNKPLYSQSIDDWKHYQLFLKESIG